jgi:adenine-specific DNA methylase
MYILYKTVNIINGRYYIGVSNTRKKYYKGSGTALREAIRYYGPKNFKREIIATFETYEEAYKREAEIVNEDFVADPQTYNIKVGGKGGIGQPKTDEHKKKLKASRSKQINNNGGNKRLTPKKEMLKLVKEYGLKETSKILGISYEAARSRYYRCR